MRTQAIAVAVAAPLLALGIPQAAAYTTPYHYYGSIDRPILASTAVRRPVAAAAVVRRNYQGRAVVPRVGTGARVGRTGPGNRGLGR